MIQTDNLTLQKFQENFDFIESKMKDSQMYKDALQSFTEYMPDHAFTDDQKALAYSDFMSKTFLGVFNTAVQTALTIDLNEIQTRDAQNQSALGVLAKKKETAILSNQVKESFFKIQASKMQTAQLQAQALQDKIKAEVLHKSANDNAQINKANCMVSYQNVLSNANKPDLLNSLEMQKTTVDALKAIGEAPISDYTDEWARVKIPDYNTDFDTTMIEIYVTKNIISVNEVVAFNIISSVEIIEDIWDFGDNTNAYGDNILKSYKQAGEYKVIYKAKVQVENPHYKSDSENTDKTQENRDVSHSLNMTETNAATQDISHSQDVSNKDVSTLSQHDTKDQDMRSRHSEALAEESNNKDVSAMPQHDENSSHSEGAIATEESKIESNHDSSHSEGVKTTEESNKDTSQDVSHTDVSGLKALNMTDRGNMTQEDMTKPVILNASEESHNKDVSLTLNMTESINTKDKFVIKEYTRTLEILVK